MTRIIHRGTRRTSPITFRCGHLAPIQLPPLRPRRPDGSIWFGVAVVLALGVAAVIAAVRWM